MDNNQQRVNQNRNQHVLRDPSQKAIDIYLTPTFQDGKPTEGSALRVFKEKVMPQYEETHKKLDQIKNEMVTSKSYPPFDENSYSKHIREFESSDGMAYLYSHHKRMKIIDNQHHMNQEMIQMLVCVTMYGEERNLVVNTLSAIASNLEEFQKINVSSKQIVVVILQDGITKMKEEMVEFYSEQDYMNNAPYSLVERRHIIEQQTQFLKYQKRESVINFNQGLPDTIPKKTALLYQNKLKFHQSELITFTVFKHLNGKKLSSHLWFFEGFCRQFQPKYCVLVDAGTQPENLGLVKMYLALEGDKEIGGVCGFMGLKQPTENSFGLPKEQVYIMEQKINKMKDGLSQDWEGDFQSEKEKQKLQIALSQYKLDEIRSNQPVVQDKKTLFQLFSIENIKSKQRSFLSWLICVFNVLFFVIWALSFVLSTIGTFLEYIGLGLSSCINSFISSISLEKAQIYEYTTAHMVDKNFESSLGFLHVLPGAWSAYRYKALNITKENRENLIQKLYLKSILNPSLMSNTIEELNMFLAEDRILCLGIYCQINSHYTLKYIPEAKAYTDPVGTLEEFMNQRRRWINSSWFALNYVLQNCDFCVEDSSHTWWTKNVTFQFNILFAQIGKFNTYFIPAFYLFVALLSSFQFLSPSYDFKLIDSLYSFEHQSEAKCQTQEIVPTNICGSEFEKLCYISCYSGFPQFIFAFLNLVPAVFIMILILIIFASLLFKPKNVEISTTDTDTLKKIEKYISERRELQNEEKKERGRIQNKVSQNFQNNVFKVLSGSVSIISGLTFMIVSLSVLFNLLNNSFGVITSFQKLSTEFRIYLGVMLILNYGTFYLCLFIHLLQAEMVWDVLRSFLSYWFFSPIYNHILLIFSFCNIDDVTWGTKGLTGSSEDNKAKSQKISFVAEWIMWNTVLLTVLIISNTISSNTPYVIMGLGGFGTAYSFIKTIFAIFNYLKYFAFDKWIYSYRRNKKSDVNLKFVNEVEKAFREMQYMQMNDAQSNPDLGQQQNREIENIPQHRNGRIN